MVHPHQAGSMATGRLIQRGQGMGMAWRRARGLGLAGHRFHGVLQAGQQAVEGGKRAYIHGESLGWHAPAMAYWTTAAAVRQAGSLPQPGDTGKGRRSGRNKGLFKRLRIHAMIADSQP
jgi:hypothetical protein